MPFNLCFLLFSPTWLFQIAPSTRCIQWWAYKNPEAWGEDGTGRTRLKAHLTSKLPRSNQSSEWSLRCENLAKLLWLP